MVMMDNKELPESGKVVVEGKGTMGSPQRPKTDVSCRGRLTRSSEEVSELRSNHEFPKEINSL